MTCVCSLLQGLLKEAEVTRGRCDRMLVVQSVPITTKVVSSNPAQKRCTRYKMIW